MHRVRCGHLSFAATTALLLAFAAIRVFFLHKVRQLGSELADEAFQEVLVTIEAFEDDLSATLYVIDGDLETHG